MKGRDPDRVFIDPGKIFTTPLSLTLSNLRMKKRLFSPWKVNWVIYVIAQESCYTRSEGRQDKKYSNFTDEKKARSKDK